MLIDDNLVSKKSLPGFISSDYSTTNFQLPSASYCNQTLILYFLKISCRNFSEIILQALAIVNVLVIQSQWNNNHQNIIQTTDMLLKQFLQV